MNTALNRTTVLQLTNKSGGLVAQGDVVIIDSSTASSFTTTTSAAQTGDTVGVVFDPGGIASNAIGAVAVAGYVPKINLSGAASLGDTFGTHSVAKQAAAHAAVIAGDFGQVLEASATPKAYIWGAVVQSTPSFPLADSTWLVKGSGDATKRLRFEVDGFTTSTDHVVTVPDTDITMAGKEVDNAWSAKQTFNKALVTAPVALTDAATIATDASLGNHFRVTLGGNRTLGAPTNPSDGQIGTWEFIQDGTGSRTITLNAIFALGTDISTVTLTTTASARDFMTAKYNSTANKWYVLGFVRGY